MRADTPEKIEQWVDKGAAMKSSMAPADLLQLTDAITPEAFMAQLKQIVEPENTRFVGVEGNTNAAARIEAAFKSYGLQTEMQPLASGPVPALLPYTTKPVAGNVIGYIKGTSHPDEVVIVSCHYDSVNWENTAASAPGVDDNGSGVALMMMLAKALSTTKPSRSILFVSFQAEEEGLVGSKVFAEQFRPGGSYFTKYGKPVAAIVADEVAWPGKTAAGRKVIFETKGQSPEINAVVDTMAHAAQQQCSTGAQKADCVQGFVVNYHGFGSDHISMLDVGVPAILLIERDNMYHADTWGHTAKDTFEHVDVTFGAATTRLALQAVATMATPQ
jgi:Zn-dependent M28 family amino/carboxypeptidase